jgi:signal transduction protein with GAF and PtsI domain
VSEQIGTGTRVFEAPPVRGRWRRLSSPDDVIALLDDSAEGVIACVADAGATFLAPIFDDLTAVVCLSGTTMSHIGIVSREYRVPCLMGVALAFDPDDDAVVEVDCTVDPGVVRVP